MDRKRKAVVGWVLVFLLILASCSSNTSPPPQGSEEDPGGDTQAPQTQSLEVQVFYTNAQATELIMEERTVEYATEMEKYEQTLSLLMNPAAEEDYSLWPNLQYHSLSLEDGRFTIDLDGSVQYNLGAGTEMLAVQALISTLFQFAEIDEVQILIDGETAESLTGHVDISKPFKKERE